MSLLAFCRFIEQIQSGVPGRGLKEQLEVLCFTYGLSLLITNAGDFLSTEYLTGKQVMLAKDELKRLFDQVSTKELA